MYIWIDELEFVMFKSNHSSTVTVGASGVDWGGVFSSTLANQLIKPMTEVLHLTGAQDTPHSHQLGMMRMVETSSCSPVDVAPTSLCSLQGVRADSTLCPSEGLACLLVGGPCDPEETQWAFCWWLDWCRAGFCSTGKHHILPLSDGMFVFLALELLEQIQPVTIKSISNWESQELLQRD